MTRLDAIRERCEMATRGPWFEVKTTKAGKTFTYSRLPFELPGDLLNNDQIFVSHSRTDIPYLLTRLAKAEQALKVVREHPHREAARIPRLEIEGFDKDFEYSLYKEGMAVGHQDAAACTDEYFGEYGE